MRTRQNSDVCSGAPNPQSAAPKKTGNADEKSNTSNQLPVVPTRNRTGFNNAREIKRQQETKQHSKQQETLTFAKSEPTPTAKEMQEGSRRRRRRRKTRNSLSTTKVDEVKGGMKEHDSNFKVTHEVFVDYDRDAILLDFSNFIGLVPQVWDAISDISALENSYARMLLPRIGDDGSYCDAEDNPCKWFDIWGVDSADGDGAGVEETPKSSIIYCHLKQDRLPELPDEKAAREQVVSRLQKKYMERENDVFQCLRRLNLNSASDALAKLEGRELDGYDFLDAMIAVARGIVASEEAVDEAQHLLQNSAAIIRGRIEELLLRGDVSHCCLPGKAWFTFMMAAWSAVRMSPKEKEEQFQQLVMEDTIPAPGFFRWPSVPSACQLQ